MHVALCRQYHSKYHPLPGQYLVEEGIINSAHTSLELCTYLCSKDEECLAYSYTRANCRLSNLRPVVTHNISGCDHMDGGSESGTGTITDFIQGLVGTVDIPSDHISCRQFSNVTMKGG